MDEEMKRGLGTENQRSLFGEMMEEIREKKKKSIFPDFHPVETD